MTLRGRIIAGVVAVLAAAFAVGGILRILDVFQTNQQRAGAARTGEIRVSPGLKMGGAFDLIDHDGKPVTDKDLRGRFALIYFGYTFCPDVCPTELLIMGQALDRMGNDAEKVRPVFITIDPERDTREVLARYVGNFHPRLLALGGPPVKVRAALKAYGVYAVRAEPQDGAAPDEYLMNHTSFVYLVGPEGRTRTLFSRGTDPDVMARQIRKYMND